MPLQWHVWWKQELDKLFFRPTCGRNQSVVYPYTSFVVEDTEIVFDVTEELESCVKCPWGYSEFMSECVDNEFGPMILTCNNHDGGSSRMDVHPPINPAT
eukprot:15334136-Ditylum_brightwellii.AAC.1